MGQQRRSDDLQRQREPQFRCFIFGQYADHKWVRRSQYWRRNRRRRITCGQPHLWGTNTLTLTGLNTYTGATTINNRATLQLGNGQVNGNIASTSGITDNGTLILKESSTGITLGAAITGSGGVTQNGSVFGANNTLSGTNTYSGATSVNAGTLTAGSTSAFGGATGNSAVTIAAGASLALNGFNNTVGSVSGASTNSSITLGAGTLTTGGNNATTAFAGVISGSGGSLTKVGTGTMTLSGTNTYSGATNLNGGTLSIGADANLGAVPGSIGATNLNFNGGTLATTASFALNASRGIAINAGGGTISVASGTVLTYGGLITGTGNLAVPGAGTLNLTGNSLNFGGSATVTSGELEFSGTLPSIGTLTLGSGSTLFLNGSDLSVGNLEITGSAIIDFGSSASILNMTTFTIDAGATLTVEDWANEVNYFYAQNWTGATLGTRGVGPETLVTFSGYSSSNTGWLSYDREISPAPEPATYGAILVGISLLGVVVYRRKRSAA